MTTIPQRELRNNISDILRRAEEGERFTITVAGRPVAELGPPPEATPRGATFGDLKAMFAKHPVDSQWAADLARMREEDRENAVDPWAD